MLAKSSFGLALVLAVVGLAQAQTAVHHADGTAAAWHPAGEAVVQTALESAAGETAATLAVDRKPSERRPITQISSSEFSLPNSHGQVWREYDISPYTVRVTSTKRPEQAVIDWILQETGYEQWHGEPLGVLSANRRLLRVYHTPEVQARVAALVQRFVNNEAESRNFNLRVITVEHPNWRSKAQRMLRPVTVQASGVGAWLLQKEEAAVLLADLRRRADYREHSSPHLVVNNGQSTLVSITQGRNYVRDVVLRPDVWPGYEAVPAQVDEGFSLEFSPLMTTDRQMIDAVVKCSINQVEKMIPVMLDVPTQVAPRQRTKVEVPQMSRFRFHERFRWPVEQVLLISMGMVPVPTPVEAKPIVPGLPLGTTAPRADMLVFIESRGANETGGPRVTQTPQVDARTYRGRY